MKNTTIAMVAVLAAVVMLSAGLAVAPMQQASATTVMNGGGDSEVKTGDNKVIIKQSNECEEVEDESCVNNLPDGMITQNSGEDDFPPGPP
jgi:hypothetical protein